MNWIKLGMCIIFLLFTGAILSPECTAVTISRIPAGYATAAVFTNDGKFLVPPAYNCDPGIFIPGNQHIDPDILLKGMP